MKKNPDVNPLAEATTAAGIWEWNIESGKKYLSPSWKLILGFADNELPTINDFFDLIHTEDRLRAEFALTQHFKTDEPFSIEIRMHNKAGGYPWVLLSGQCKRDESGRAVKMEGVFSDVTELKLTQNLLTASEEKFLQTFDSHATPMQILDLETGERLEINKKCLELYGVTDVEELANSIYQDNRWSESWKQSESVQQLLRDGYLKSYPISFTNLKGDTRELLADAVLTESKKGRSAIISYTDITATAQQERMARLRQERRDAIQMLHDVDVETDEKEFVQLALKSLEELTKSRISFFHLIDEKQENIELFAWSERTLEDYCRAEDLGHYPATEAGIWADSLRKREPVIINDYESAEGKRGLPEGHAELKRMLNVPIIERNEVVCILGVGNKQESYKEFDTETTQIIGREVWRSLQRRRLETTTKRLGRIVETSQNEIYTFDPSTLRFNYVNQQAMWNLGYTMEEFKSLTPVDIKPDFTFNSFTQQIRGLKELRQEKLVFTTTHKRKDGSTYPVEVHLQYLPDDEPVYVAIVIDISSRMEMESQLRKLALAVEQSPNSIVITNLEGEIEYINDSFTHINGYTINEVIGKNPRVLQSGKTSEDTYFKLWDTLISGQAWTGEFVNKKKNGEEILVEVIITPILNPSGEATHYVGIQRDITEERANEQELDLYRDQLEQLVDERTSQLTDALKQADTANLAKSRLLANVSHEIRTPMNAIVGLTNLLQGDSLTDKQHARLGKIESSTHYLLSIINDFLDLSKIEAGKLELELLNFDLHDVLHYIHNLFKPQVKAKNLEFAINTGDTSPWLRGDATRLRQALLNYVSNAIKFTEVGKVSLNVTELETSGEKVLLKFEVSDTGIGLSEESIGKLFESFTQADASTTRKYEGTGLGLAITKSLVQIMDGQIGVESELGEGSTFWFTAWLEQGQPGATGDESKDLASEDDLKKLKEPMVGKRILVVDDNLINLEVTTAMLEREHILVETAENGREAIEKMRQTNFDMVLMDIQMPEMDGLEATRIIREMPDDFDRKAEIPIIAMTANAFKEDRLKCEQAGMSDFVAKPVDPDKFYAIVSKWMN